MEVASRHPPQPVRHVHFQRLLLEPDTLALEISHSMGPLSIPHLFLPFTRAISQFDDPTFRGVLFRSIAWSIACFAVLHAGTIWIIHREFGLHGWLARSVDVLGSVAASLLTLWLFLPVAAAIGTIYFERIASSVERRFYPWLPPARGASILDQALDGVVLAFRVLALNLLALALAILLPGFGLILGWLISSYAIGRGLFVAVAMRRMPRAMAEALYRASRAVVLTHGAILALAAYVPPANLLIPMIGVATMVHVLDMALTAAETGGR
jgi:CysZ protein